MGLNIKNQSAKGKMADQDSNSENGQRRFSQEQYEMIKRCSDKRDMTEWNEWRRKHPLWIVNLCGAKLKDFVLFKVNLGKANLQEADLSGAGLLEANFEEAFLRGANLSFARLNKANLRKIKVFSQSAEDDIVLAGTTEKTSLLDRMNMLDYSRYKGVIDLSSAILDHADMSEANLCTANLENATIAEAQLQQTLLNRSNLRGVNLNKANLQGAHLVRANMKHACLIEANLMDSNFKYANLCGASLQRAVVSGGTSFWQCYVDKHTFRHEGTDFNGVGLENALLDPGTKQLLEYNIRRKNWEDWYKEHPKFKCLVKPFWWVSDYGLSTWRIIVTFFALAFIFANIYYHWGKIAPPGIVENLFVDRNGIVVPSWLVPLRTLYFSIVTMTTLGFGDMYANAQSIWGHILLSIQVILGYVLLGALVTRFAVLFTAGGPAGKFANDN